MSCPCADKNVAILFGDGAGACLICPDGPCLAMAFTAIHSDGSFAQEVRGEVHMNVFSVIMQASRKIPAAIQEVLGAAGISAESVQAFLVHQSNRNLIDRAAAPWVCLPNAFIQTSTDMGIPPQLPCS